MILTVRDLDFEVCRIGLGNTFGETFLSVAIASAFNETGREGKRDVASDLREIEAAVSAITLGEDTDKPPGARGRVIGIIPAQVSFQNGRYDRKPEYPKPYVEIPIFTHLD